MMPHLISDNWLLSYAKIEGIQRVLDGMNKRTKNRSGMHTATNELRAFYTEFETEFTSFFKELIIFTAEKRIEITKSLLEE